MVESMLARLALLACVLGGPAWAGEPVVKTLAVPAELAAVTSTPEPSGIVWSPQRGRYLVASDDTGLRSQGTRHTPWLFALAENGFFDRTPIPIRGVETINDAEALCAGPHGTYFLVTSHSPNHLNRTRASRRQLLQLKEEAGELVVAARTDLTSIVGGGPSLLALAALPPAGRLDIEAVSYRGGVLYIGLKSPLTRRGEAVILRLSHAVETLREGKLRERSLERLAAVPLCVTADGRQVCQGIADMTFLPDGSLVVAANAPKGGPPDHGGALWHLPVPVGKKPPILLHRFLRLKPEGVTLSPALRSLIVVFDRDGHPGQWAEVPLPRLNPP